MACTNTPQNIRKGDWYYEYPGYILVVHEVRDDQGNYIKTDQFRIPWKMLEVSRRRRPKKR